MSVKLMAGSAYCSFGCGLASLGSLDAVVHRNKGRRFFQAWFWAPALTTSSRAVDPAEDDNWSPRVSPVVTKRCLRNKLILALSSLDVLHDEDDVAIGVVGDRCLRSVSGCRRHADIDRHVGEHAPGTAAFRIGRSLVSRTTGQLAR